MKNFSKFINENKVSGYPKISLKDIPEKLAEKIKNLEGRTINECCCGCCCNDLKTSLPEENQIVWFYSQQEIVNKIKTDVKVNDIYNIHNQFNDRFKFKGETPAKAQEPLYFKEITYANEPYAYYNNYISNVKLYGFIKELCNKFNLGSPIVLDCIDGKLKVFFNINSGSNGSECSIKSSLIKMVQILNGLKEYKEITWAQILDVSIDNADDVYTFLFTIEVDTSLFKNEETKATVIKIKDDNIDNKEDINIEDIEDEEY